MLSVNVVLTHDLVTHDIIMEVGVSHQYQHYHGYYYQ